MTEDKFNRTIAIIKLNLTLNIICTIIISIVIIARLMGGG